MWFLKKPAPVYLTNTLTGKKELVRPLTPGRISLYSCGPTVYGPIHIGNLRSFVLSDLIARILTDAGYEVKRVMNITDVGHMVGDGDEGEDKIQVGAAREQSTPKEIADKYTDLFLRHLELLNFETKEITFTRATDYIKEQIAMIEELEKKGLAYPASNGIYFDTEKFGGYGALGNIQAVELRAGARVEMVEGKKNQHDFALWRFAKANDLQQWDSPWGRGNPGWSIECSAMATAKFGEQIDIHTGGEDLASVHHNNEIAQSEGASGKHPFVRTWVHGAFLNIDGARIAKSTGNTISLDEVAAKDIDPLALRYLYLQAHYRKPLSFTWEALSAAHEALMRLRRAASEIRKESGGKEKSSPAETTLRALVADDLATPAALALIFDSLKSGMTAAQKYSLLRRADSLFGLSLFNNEVSPHTTEGIPAKIQEMVEKREEARKNKDFAAADELRIHIANGGYHVDDGASGPIVTKLAR